MNPLDFILTGGYMMAASIFLFFILIAVMDGNKAAGVLLSIALFFGGLGVTHYGHRQLDKMLAQEEQIGSVEPFSLGDEFTPNEY